jgi:hypothetical protein
LKLPVAETAGKFYLSMAACLVALAFTIAATVASNWHGALGSSQEVSMDTKVVYCKVVCNSVLEVTKAAGAAAIGGLLAA